MPTEPDFELVEFKYTWMGHLITGALVAASIGVLSTLGCWILGAASLVPLSWSFGQLVLSCVIAWFVAETVSALLHQAHASAQKHDSPGGWLPPVWMSALYVISYPLAAYFVSGDQVVGLVVLGVTLVVTVGVLVVFKPWLPGMTRMESRQAWRATRIMTEEHKRGSSS